MRLTEQGRTALGINSGQSDRQGGPEHRYWIKRIAKHLRASGYKVAEEVPVGGGKTIDLVARREGKRIAFEIETGKSDAAANVRKCLDAGIDKTVVVATTEEVRDRLAGTIGQHPAVEILSTAQIMERFPE